MLLCFNRGYVKQMAALPLQVVSIGTAINSVVPCCGTAEILLKLSFELSALGTKGILTFHLCTWWHRGWSCILHCSCLRPHIFSPSEMLSVQALMGMGQFALISQSLLFVWGVFLLLFLSLNEFFSLYSSLFPMNLLADAHVPHGRRKKKTFLCAGKELLYWK